MSDGDTMDDLQRRLGALERKLRAFGSETTAILEAHTAALDALGGARLGLPRWQPLSAVDGETDALTKSLCRYCENGALTVQRRQASGREDYPVLAIVCRELPEESYTEGGHRQPRTVVAVRSCPLYQRHPDVPEDTPWAKPGWGPDGR